MKSIARFLSLSLACLLLGGVALADASVLNAEAEFPTVLSPITLRFAAPIHQSHTDYNEMWFFKVYEEMTGIHIEWDLTPQSNWTERKNLLLASNDLPDVFYRGSLSSSDLVTYGTQGMLLDLVPLIEAYGPHMNAYFGENPDVRKAVTESNGAIYALPGTIEALGPRTDKMWINADWLAALGLDMPATIDDLYQVLVAFRDKDVNGNGKQDELAVCISSNRMPSAVKCFMGMFGLGTLGGSAAGNLIDLGEDGALRAIAVSDRYRGMLEFLNKLWTEGLWDKDALTQSDAQVMAKGEANLIGVYPAVNNPTLLGTVATSYTTTPALVGPYGDQLWANVVGLAYNFGAYAITNVCPYPEAALRWADYFYCYEGIVLLRKGIEGETYEVLEDGSMKVFDEVNFAEGLTIDQALGRYWPTPAGALPQVQYESLAVDMSQPMTVLNIEGGKLLEPYMPKNLWRPVFSIEETTRLSVLADLTSYVTEMQTKFITGAESFDKWDAYVSTCQAMGLSEYLTIFQAAYDRSMAE